MPCAVWDSFAHPRTCSHARRPPFGGGSGTSAAFSSKPEGGLGVASASMAFSTGVRTLVIWLLVVNASGSFRDPEYWATVASAIIVSSAYLRQALQWYMSRNDDVRRRWKWRSQLTRTRILIISLGGHVRHVHEVVNLNAGNSCRPSAAKRASSGY